MRTVEELRPLTAGQLLELWRQCREEAEDPLERTMLCNARILALCCRCQGAAVYTDETAVLTDLTPRQMERLLRQLAEGGNAETVNPAFDEERFETLRGE